MSRLIGFLFLILAFIFWLYTARPSTSPFVIGYGVLDEAGADNQLGYYSIGQVTSVMVKGGTVYDQILTQNKGKTVELVIRIIE